MKTIFTFLLFLLYFTTFSQVKVGENPNNVNNSALFEMESTSKGFLPPRMTTAQRDAIQNPALGLMVFNTTTSCVEVFYGTFWQSIHCGCSIAPSNLTFTDNGPITFCLNQAIAINSSATQGGNPGLYAVSPVLPAGLFLNSTSGQITGTPTSISSATDYTITASNACGSTMRLINISVLNIPSTPPTISGLSVPTINTSVNYSITAVSGATSYTWTVPTGWIINSGQGTTSIAVTAGTSAGNITVTAINTCGTSSASTKAVSSWRPIVATGGTVSNYTANGTNGVNGVQYRFHSFTTVGNSSFNISDAGTSGQLDYLIVAGGGAGGAAGGTDGSGGGGAGGYRTGIFNVSSQNYNIVVGAGGTSWPNNAINHNPANHNGQNSSVFGLTAIGGGSASSESNISRIAQNGGSGGGAGGYSGSPGNGTPGQGNNGGACTGPGDGGGGGAGSVGQNGNSRNGGQGISNSITGTLITYAGGGGASGDPRNGLNSGGIGGSGGGGNGASASSGSAPQNGTNGLGGGGGGAAGSSPVGSVRPTGAGGSGIVIIRYPITNPNP